MIAIPTPPPGHVSAITIATPDLDRSFTFYSQLGFKELMRTDFPFPFIQITDGALLMMLRKDPTPYIALTYYVTDVAQRAALLEASGIRFSSKPKAGDFIQKYVTQSPDGLNISFVDNMAGGFTQPTGKTMLTMPPQDYTHPAAYTNQVCGMFGELACPVKDLNVSIVFWEQLGFTLLSRMSSRYDWAIMSDGLAIIGLHQTIHFTQPAITFFAADMEAKLTALKSGGLEELKDRNTEGNTTITSPEGQLINLFKLGI